MEPDKSETMFFSSNIKLLRHRRGRTQDETASTLGMKRSTLSGYENNVAQPSLDVAIAFADYFRISLDTLLRMDLRTLRESQIDQLERGNDVFIRGGSLRILATTIDSENEENIELVPEKAKAGYKSGFADPEFIKVLPAFRLPFLSREKKYRTFQISGDSMLPVPDGSWVTGEYVENWEYIKDRQPYIILTLDEGIVFKIVENRISDESRLYLHSLNQAYKPYAVDIGDVREVWKFIHYISGEMPEPNTQADRLVMEIREMRNQIQAIQLQLDLWQENTSARE
ncbi:MAG: LexA family transcriptional regulator [Bacteroidales bacterium]|nr:LexA family transcriptional regulator [Bacteroidales bacterium]